MLTSGSLAAVLSTGSDLGLAHIGWAVVAAVLSTVCYATGAVLQQRQTDSADDHLPGMTLVWALARSRWWWLTAGMTLAGALLHVLALSLGSLTIVQPLGVLTLVLALPLGARLGEQAVTGTEWCGALAVVAGLGALLTVMPHHRQPPPLGPMVILALGALTTGLVLGLLLIAAHLPRRGGAVALAGAAGLCFGCASAMARLALTTAAAPLLAGSLAVLGAATGLAVTQLAYRDGGLGAPLATLTLLNPLTAVIIAITLLGEPFGLTPARATLALAGLAATTLGIATLTRTRESPRPAATPQQPATP